jgi:hypothetical protein
MKYYFYLLSLTFSSMVWAGKADVIEVKVRCSGSCTFNVTLKHADTGWEHYANQWDVVAADGRVLGSRVLYHPHVNEQPFTRALSGVKIPAGIKQVTIRAKDSKHGYGGIEKTIDLPDR